MEESPVGMEQVKSFDLLRNPFCLLRIEPTATLESIADAYDDALTDRVALEADLVAAREAVVNPRQRTSIELAYLIDTPSGEVAAILNSLRNNPNSIDLLRVAARLAPLSKANLLVHAAARQPATADLLFALVEAHAQLNKDRLQAKLRTIRKTAGLVVPSIENVQDALHKLLTTHAKAALSGFLASRDSVNPVAECARRVFASTDSDRVDALEGVMRAFGQAISFELSRIEEELRAGFDALRNRPKAQLLVTPISKSLHNWIDLARPLVEFDAHKGRDEERARALFNEVRGLAVDLANEHDSFDVSLSISKVASEIFKSLPRATDQLENDLRFLEERSTELLVVPLKKWIDDLRSNGTSGLIRDLESSGFGKTSTREAKELWDGFVAAVQKTKNTEASDFPWMLLRSLAVDINNEDNAPEAAKAILCGLNACAPTPSAKIRCAIDEDLDTVERNIREKKLIDDLKENRVSQALGNVYELLKAPKTQDDKESLTKLKAQLESKRTARHAKWVVIGLIGAAILYANVSEKSSPPRSAYNVPTSTGQTSSNYPTGLPQIGYPPSNTAPPKPHPLLEEIPPIGSGAIFSQNNVRYCLYQKERLKPIESDLRNDDEITQFSRLIDDYNGRCGNFKYRVSDLEIITAEVDAKSSGLAEEGRNIVQTWRRPSVTIPQSSISPQAASPPPPNTMVPEASDPSIGPGVGLPSKQNLDLLDLANSSAVQARLADLGYFKGPINGAWGPQSRAALRTFKNANGLADDDLFDLSTANSLRASSARRNPPSGGGTNGGQRPTESAYPPPLGAALNPLNRVDASKIHSKLRALGSRLN